MNDNTNYSSNEEKKEAIEKALNWVNYELDNGRVDSAENWLATAVKLSMSYIEEGIECVIANKITNAHLRCTFAQVSTATQ